MLSICTVLILIILGIFFIKKDTQKELTKFAKDNAMLIGIALLLFLFYGRNMVEGIKSDNEVIEEKEDIVQKGINDDGEVVNTKSINDSKNIKPPSPESELKYASFKELDRNNDGFLSRSEYNNVSGTMNMKRNERGNATKNVTGNATKNVTGNATKNVTGNATKNVTGNVVVNESYAPASSKGSYDPIVVPGVEATTYPAPDMSRYTMTGSPGGFELK